MFASASCTVPSRISMLSLNPSTVPDSVNAPLPCLNSCSKPVAKFCGRVNAPAAVI